MPFATNLGFRNIVFRLLPAVRLPNVTFVPQTDSGFVLLLQPSAGDRFRVSAGSYRLALDLTLAEVGADTERQVSTVANGYVQVALEDLSSPAPLDTDWFTSDTVTGLGRDASGKWLVRMRGSSKPLANPMSFAAIRISFVHAALTQGGSSGGVSRRSTSLPITVVAHPSASLSVTYVLG
jgi:hypothetical protein